MQCQWRDVRAMSVSYLEELASVFSDYISGDLCSCFIISLFYISDSPFPLLPQDWSVLWPIQYPSFVLSCSARGPVGRGLPSEYYKLPIPPGNQILVPIVYQIQQAICRTWSSVVFSASSRYRCFVFPIFILIIVMSSL